ncbi:putative thioredoxin [Synechococcus phage S-BM1]|nr:putative thioredoxin [Synechococcus phage S-BM1]
MVKNHFLMFTKDSCGPCGLVKRYIYALNDPRIATIEEINLEDFSDQPIPEKNLEIAKKYGVTATPVLVVTDAEGNELVKYTGGMEITQNIRKVWNKYV